MKIKKKRTYSYFNIYMLICNCDDIISFTFDAGPAIYDIIDNDVTVDKVKLHCGDGSIKPILEDIKKAKDWAQRFWDFDSDPSDGFSPQYVASCIISSTMRVFPVEFKWTIPSIKYTSSPDLLFLLRLDKQLMTWKLSWWKPGAKKKIIKSKEYKLNSDFRLQYDYSKDVPESLDAYTLLEEEFYNTL